MHRLIVYDISFGYPLKIYEFVDGKCVFDRWGRGEDIETVRRVYRNMYHLILEGEDIKELEEPTIRVWRTEGPEVDL